MDILIRNVRVGIPRRRYATYTYKQHHGIITDMLSRKWVIILDKSNNTLQSTTQDNARSYLKLLTQWYRKYFLLQRLSRLNLRFYIDTLFAKDKSIVGKTCALIFEDGEFVEIISMKYKSEAGSTLYRIKWDVGVANEIFMENVSEQTGYNTEMHSLESMERMDI